MQVAPATAAEIAKIQEKSERASEESIIDMTEEESSSQIGRAVRKETMVMTPDGEDVIVEAQKEGVPDLDGIGIEMIRYMTHCTGGHVFLGKLKKSINRDYVAVKRFTSEDNADYELLAKEATMMRLSAREEVLKLLNCVVYGPAIYMITPACNLGSLHDVLANHCTLGISETAAQIIFRQVISALAHIHEERRLHRDLRPRHILLSSDGKAKLSGFRHIIEVDYRTNSCHDFDNHLQRQIYYFAPEVLAQNMQGYGSKSDIYMVGMSLCEALNGVVPFSEADPLEMLYRKLTGMMPRPVDSASVKDDAEAGLDISGLPSEHKNRTFSAELHNFVNSTLAFNPDDRPCARQLYTDKWFAKLEHHEHNLMEHLNLDPRKFSFDSWEKEPLIDAKNEQKLTTHFDYSSLE